jgi:hypothetical protein
MMSKSERVAVAPEATERVSIMSKSEELQEQYSSGQSKASESK